MIFKSECILIPALVCMPLLSLSDICAVTIVEQKLLTYIVGNLPSSDLYQTSVTYGSFRVHISYSIIPKLYMSPDWDDILGG